MAVANEYQGKPICFIAVNSGNNSKSVARYLSENNIAWPTIVDTNREFEKAAINREISLNNVWQTYTVDGEGKLQSIYSGKKDTFKEHLDSVLADVSWNVDPSLIPADLQEAWLSIEFGNFPPAAKTLQRALKSRKEEIKTAAETLNAFVQSKLEPAAKSAAEMKEDEKYWDAYKAYLELESQYSGYFDDTINIKTILKELKSEETVGSELAALKQLQNASVIAARSGFPKVVGRLKKLIEKYPDTEAAVTAQTLIDENGAE